MSKKQAVNSTMDNKNSFMICNKMYIEQMIEKVNERKTVNIYKAKLKNILHFRKNANELPILCK